MGQQPCTPRPHTRPRLAAFNNPAAPLVSSSASLLTRWLPARWLSERRRADRRLWEGFHHHSRTFSLAARLLPRRVRLPVATLYLFCRRVDTLADERAFAVGPAQALDELEAIEARLDAALHGRPPDDDLLWPRLAEVHERFGLAPGPLRELIDGARWDLNGRPVTDEDDLLDYSMLVGGSVGAMMLPFLAPDRREQLDASARTLGVAMQITNIVRDVGEDLRERDRRYLPAAWLREAGLSESDLRAHLPTGTGVPPGYPAVLERAMRLAEARYRRGLDGVGKLPTRMRLGIRSAARMYREIHNEVRANDYDDLSRRAYTSRGRKLRLVVQDDYSRRRERLLGRTADDGQWTVDDSSANA
ncbi:MAG: squalene/phytoene synthase family protein [Bacteroidetes bacterium QS_8_68_15]|nr:MAG: squalene/phytoene synthase family protein [Bacteroidetes bacterium QS_8_68_15]